MRLWTALTALAAIAACAWTPARADGPYPYRPMTPQATAAAISANVQQTLQLNDGLRLDLRKGYVFLPAAQVQPVLTKLKADPPRAPILGAVAPAGKQPGASDYWVAVIAYEPIGRVPETGGDEMTSMSYIYTVQAARPSVQAFAAPPSYDPLNKTLTWAELYAAKSKNDNALRYEQRLLGKDGVCSVTMISRAGLLERVRVQAPAVRNMISFTEGRRYIDWVTGRDRDSDYDLPGLIDGSRRAISAATTPVEPAPSPGVSFNWRALLPGGKYGWATYVGGGLAILLISSAIFSLFRGGGGGGGRGRYSDL